MWRPTPSESFTVQKKLCFASNPLARVDSIAAFHAIEKLYQRALNFGGYFNTLEELVVYIKPYKPLIVDVPDKPLHLTKVATVTPSTKFTDEYQSAILDMYRRHGFDPLAKSDCEVKARKLLSVLTATDELTDYAKRYCDVALTSGHHLVTQDGTVYLAGRRISNSSYTRSVD